MFRVHWNWPGALVDVAGVSTANNLINPFDETPEPKIALRFLLVTGCTYSIIACAWCSETHNFLPLTLAQVV